MSVCLDPASQPCEPPSRHVVDQPDTVAAVRAVDALLAHGIAARAIDHALKGGVIDRLGERRLLEEAELAAELGSAPERIALLVSLLVSADVLCRKAGGLALSESFRRILPFRDLLEAKLGFLALASADLDEYFAAFIDAPDRFIAQSRTFELFRYDRCFELTPENLAATRRWVSYTSCLTRYEAGPCWDRIDLDGARRLLDLGGNSGEFAARACAKAPQLTATVADLPVVCAIGREMLAGRPELPRVSYLPLDMRFDALPAGHDLISFKSVLHDWPADEAFKLMARACAALPAGGQLLIYERARIPIEDMAMSYAAAANLVFAPFFRDAGFYIEALGALGLREITAETVEIETPFHLITARKPGGPA